MSVREFRSPDGRRWHAFAVAPASALSERRQGDRRTTPVEMVDDPPVLERRHETERRTRAASRSTRRPAELLPSVWRDGWLAFKEAVSDDVVPSRGETRRLTPIPERWDTCTELELVAYLLSATPQRQGSAASIRPSPNASEADPGTDRPGDRPTHRPSRRA